MLTSSNYNDDQKKTTGGRNGYGAKLANIFSTYFQIDTGDSKKDKVFKMTWKNNMTTKSEPQIAFNENEEDYTKITFKPDFGKFGMEGLEGDILPLMKKRVKYDFSFLIDFRFMILQELYHLK